MENKYSWQDMYGQQINGNMRCGIRSEEQSWGQKLNLAIIYKVMFKANMLGSIFERKSLEKKENGYTEFWNHQYWGYNIIFFKFKYIQ